MLKGHNNICNVVRVKVELRGVPEVAGVPESYSDEARKKNWNFSEFSTSSFLPTI